jgi:hypothetical protein
MIDVADGEPVFTLRASDLLAPVVVNLYAIQCTMHGVNTDRTEEVRQVARDMKEWQEVYGCKKPE